MAAKVDKAALLAALAPKLIEHPVEGFGVVFIRQLSVTEVEKLRDSIAPPAAKGGKGAKAAAQPPAAEGPDFAMRLVLTSVVDSDGAVIFDEGDLPALKDSSNLCMDRLVGRTLELNGFTKEQEKKD